MNRIWTPSISNIVWHPWNDLKRPQGATAPWLKITRLSRCHTVMCVTTTGNFLLQNSRLEEKFLYLFAIWGLWDPVEHLRSIHGRTVVCRRGGQHIQQNWGVWHCFQSSSLCQEPKKIWLSYWLLAFKVSEHSIKVAWPNLHRRCGRSVPLQVRPTHGKLFACNNMQKKLNEYKWVQISNLRKIYEKDHFPK